MASTFSDLKFELIGTGDQAGNWGATTNDNIGTAIEQAITGLGNPVFTTDANLTISLTDTVALQTARALVLNVTSTVSLTATRELIVPTIEKQYIVQNNTTGAQSITVKTAAGSGITVPNGSKMHMYVDGVNVIDAVSRLSALTLASALPVTSGGTGLATLTANNVILGNGTSTPSFVAPGTTGNVLTSDGTTWTSTASAAGDVTLNGVQTLTNKTLTNMVFDGNYTEEVFTITDGGSVDLNPSNGTVQLWTLGASRSPTAASFASGQSITLMIDDGSAFAITWPSVTWETDSGFPPTLSTTGFTVIQLWKVSTVLYGARVGDA